MKNKTINLTSNQTVDFLLSKINDTIRSHLKKRKYKLYLYGSWAKNTAFDRSDIDIAIDAGIALEERMMLLIKQDLENIRTLRSIDLVDLHSVSYSLKEEILNSGKKLK